MKFFSSSLSACLLISAAAVLPLSLQGIAKEAAEGKVVSTLKAFKITQKDGAEQLDSAETIRPGETLEYRAVYRNNGTKPARDVQATLPIPRQLQFVASSAKPSTVLASTDGKTFATPPLRRRIKTADGVKVVAVPLAEYRYLRWNIGVLAPGATVGVAARATLVR